MGRIEDIPTYFTGNFGSGPLLPQFVVHACFSFISATASRQARLLKPRPSSGTLKNLLTQARMILARSSLGRDLSFSLSGRLEVTGTPKILSKSLWPPASSRCEARRMYTPGIGDAIRIPGLAIKSCVIEKR